MTRRLICVFFFMMLSSGWASELPAQRATQPLGNPFLTTESSLIGRIFPILSLLLSDPEAGHLLQVDPVLHKIADAKLALATTATQHCSENQACLCQAMIFKDDEIAITSAELKRLYEAEPKIRSFVGAKLKPSETFDFGVNSESELLFVVAWQHAAASINSLIGTYCEGKVPRYPEIDGLTQDMASKQYMRLVEALLSNLQLEESKEAQGTPILTFFTPSLRFAIRLLQVNERDEAARFTKLNVAENMSALEYSKRIRWSRFPYTVILLPGEGPDTFNLTLSGLGKERIRLGVAAFRAGMAPFIMVSGGFVHPAKTPYCEAVEMKRYLVNIYGIPPEAILLDPYARHTTTNLRNASREIYQNGWPSDRPMLIVSDAVQTAYIESQVFKQRNIRELGYEPVMLLKKLSPTAVEALPAKHSLLRDAADPLDP